MRAADVDSRCFLPAVSSKDDMASNRDCSFGDVNGQNAVALVCGGGLVCVDRIIRHLGSQAVYAFHGVRGAYAGMSSYSKKALPSALLGRGWLGEGEGASEASPCHHTGVHSRRKFPRGNCRSLCRVSLLATGRRR